MSKSINMRTLQSLEKPTRCSIPNYRGLYLWVQSAHKKYWIYRFTINGVRHDMGLGSFPSTSLKDATKTHHELRKLVLSGINPITEKRNEKLLAKKISDVNFEKFSTDYIERMSPQWTNKVHASQWKTSVSTYALPLIGKLSLEDISTNDILDVLSPIWVTKNETAIRLRGRLERIISAAITQGIRTKTNPAIWRGHLENLLPKLKRNHHHFAAASYQEMPQLMKKLKGDDSVASLALQFLILNASRSGEVIYAKHSEISNEIWTIPSERMKARSQHQVPLGKTSLAIVETCYKANPNSEFIFSNYGKNLYPLVLLKKVRELKNGLTVHGFRSTFRDWVGFKRKTPAYGECVLELRSRETSSPKVSANSQGDGSPDHSTCARHGFRTGTNEYAQCRMQIDTAKSQVQEQQRQYERQVAEQQKARDRAQGEAALLMGFLPFVLAPVIIPST